MQIKRIHGKKGFTLIETICAMALLTIVFAGFMVMASTASKLLIRAHATTTGFSEATKSLATDTGSSQTVQVSVDGQTFSVSVSLKSSGEGYKLYSFDPGGGS